MYDQAELLLALPPHQQPANLPEHWKDATIEARVYPGQTVPQLVINNDPMPHAYVPPDCGKWQFRPGAGGNSIWEHLPRLADFAEQCAIIVEIGIASMTGSTHAFDLGIQASDAPPNRKYHIGIDIHPSVSGPWVPKNPWWQFVSGSSQDPATVERVKDILTCGLDGYNAATLPIDLLYIDTVHEYEFLKKELENWLPVIGPHTMVVFHDTHRGGRYDRMTDAILEMVAEPVSVPKAYGATDFDRDAGPLYETHQYVQFSESCEGLGGLVPLGGWPK